MNKKESMFSDKALDKLNSSRKTEAITNISCNWIWFLLCGLSIAITSIIYWGFFGTMVDKVNGHGVTIQSGGIDAIVAKGSGILEHLNITPESDVSKNQIVGQIYNAEYFFKTRKLEIEQKELVEQLSEIILGQEKLSHHKIITEKEKEKNVINLLELMKDNRKRTYELVEMQKKLSGVGASSKVNYYGALERMVQLESTVVSTVIQRLNHMSSQQDINWQHQESRIKLNRELLAKQQEIILALKSYYDATWLRANDNGMVIEILKRVGEHVNVGDKIALVSNNSINNLTLVAFIPLESGKKVKAGMSVYFSPGALPAADYGYMVGVVVSTSPFPVSQESIYSELKNADFAKAMTARGVLMRIEVEFIPDADSTSGVKWTSKNGRNATIEPGMFGTLQINTEFRKPISYVIPYLREKMFRLDKKS